MRLFVAVRLDPELHAVLRGLQTGLQRLDTQRQVRWVDPEGIHLTLLFLGEVGPGRLPALLRGLESAAAGRAAPVLRLGSLGAFPNARRPRVLWVGVEEEGAHLGPLHEAVTQAGEALGWAREARAFQPHLTLGRVRDEATRTGLPAALLQALVDTRVPALAARPQARLGLLQSHLSPGGARYEELQGWDLEAAGRQGAR
jgi:2'-5' RNA ligase